MILPWVLVQKADNLKDDEFKHGAGEGEVDAEDELDQDVMEFIVSEEHLDKEDPTNHEEDNLAGQHYQGVT